MNTPEHFPVLIAGAGPVGSALALELARRGVQALLVDPRPNVAEHEAHGNGISHRTFEHYRRWGLAAAMRSVASFHSVPGQVRFARSFAAHDYGRDYPLYLYDEGDAAELGALIPAYQTIAILRAAAAAAGARTAYGWRLVELQQHASGVRALLQHADSAEQRWIESDYLVGCEGADSIVRASSTLVRQGAPAFGKVYVVRLRILDDDLFDPADYLQTRNGLMTCLFNEHAFGFGGIRRDDEGHYEWRGQLMGFAVDAEPSAEQLAAQAAALIGTRSRLQLIASSSFRLHTRIAECFQDGRLFLAGNSARVIPPFGGHNLNAGIGDAVDLGWKLAAVIKGWGGDALLASYDQERRPIAERTGASSLACARAFLGAADEVRQAIADGHPDLLGNGWNEAFGERIYQRTRAQWNTNGVVLDQRLQDSSLIIDDGSEDWPWRDDHYRPCARPGHRAPHAWLADGRSLYDLLGDDFALLDFADDTGQAEQLLAAARQAGLPLRHVRLHDAALATRYGARLVLVRPDQQVAWRNLGKHLDSPQIIDRIRGQQ